MSRQVYVLRPPGPGKLSAEQKVKIRTLHRDHEITTRDLAERFAVSMRTIQCVLREGMVEASA